MHTLQSLAAKADAASQQLKKKPGDATLLAKAQAAAAALTAAASTSNMPADASNCSLGQISKLADLSAVAPDDAKLNQDLYAAGVSAYDIGQQLQVAGGSGPISRYTADQRRSGISQGNQESRKAIAERGQKVDTPF